MKRSDALQLLADMEHLFHAHEQACATFAWPVEPPKATIAWSSICVLFPHFLRRLITEGIEEEMPQ